MLDINQLERILTLCGTPNDETLAKIISDEAQNYIRSQPRPRKNFTEFFTGANPDGMATTCVSLGSIECVKKFSVP